MKKNLCLILIGTLIAMNSNAQDITADSVVILDSIRELGTKVKILYVPPPKEEPKPNEFYSIQLGAYIAETPNAKFDNVENIYHIINEENIYVYLSGEFKELNDAIKERYNLIENGNSNIYVVKVIDNREIIVIE